MDSERINQAIQHRKAGEYDAAKAILSELLDAEPNNPVVNFQMAWLHDAQGLENDAVPYYERAIENGLEGNDLRGALLGLGSTYRCLGRYDEAVRTLRKGMQTFPDAREFPTFLAMALYNTGEHAEAVGLLLRILVETTGDENITAYKNAILFYHDKLDETWT